MQLIATDCPRDVAAVLDALEAPAILVDSNYQIIAANGRYNEAFGHITQKEPRCYEVSHGYDRPCDQAGESCPLSACRQSGEKERVLHIHNTPRGREHVDVEMLPIHDDKGAIRYFVELLKPVDHASAEGSDGDGMVGASPAFNRALELINRVAPSEASILLLGESGTGKELAAKAVHQASRRRGKPFVAVECAGLTDSLFESELFGHLKGAFTGASFAKKGLVEAAEGGTLFLDEVGDIPLHLQVKLLRLIETGMFRPVGSVEPKRADFRLVCATHKDLKDMVHRGEFREDLYYRINAFPIYLPALRERVEDIPLLADSILKRLEPNRRVQLAPDALTLLTRLPWEGNIRELRNILQRALLLSNTATIAGSTLELCIETTTAPFALTSAEYRVDLKTLEKQYLTGLLTEFNGDKSKVAKVAGISLRTLYRKLEA